MICLLQSLQACISWEQCKDLPVAMCSGQSVVIDGKVYFGGGKTENEGDCYLVYCYDPSQDTWTTLPPLPVRYFGLGQFSGKLIAVGGETNLSGSEPWMRNSREVYTFDAKAWKQIIPSMSSANLHPAVISHKSMLVVAGGEHLDKVTKSVEVFKLMERLWYKTNMNSLPSACFGLSIVCSDSKRKRYHILGGQNDQQNLNLVMQVSVDDFHYNAEQPKSTADSILRRVPSSPHLLGKELSSSVEDLRRGATYLRKKQTLNSPWNMLPCTPTYSPAAAMLAGSLIAIGGWDKPGGGTPQTKILKYSSVIKSWIYIGDLPAPRAKTTAAVLSSTEVLVIGGWDGISNTQVVYKLNLYLE